VEVIREASNQTVGKWEGLLMLQVGVPLLACLPACPLPCAARCGAEVAWVAGLGWADDGRCFRCAQTLTPPTVAKERYANTANRERSGTAVCSGCSFRGLT
jgi:hypothetical protein